MKTIARSGRTSYLTKIFIQDTRQANITGLTGLTFASAGLTWYYHREGDATATAVTLATMTVGTWATGGFKEIDATHLPGWYQLGVPDAALAAGNVGMALYGAANMGQVNLEIQTDGSPMDLAQAVAPAAVAATVQGALNGALAIAGGKIVQAGTDFKVYNQDGATLYKDFTLDSSTNPQQRA